MKALNHTNRTKKGITTIMLSVLFASTISAQGLLVEGASKLIEYLINKTEKEQSLFIHANYTNDAGNYEALEANVEMHPEVIESYRVSNVSLSFEEDLNTEDWMSESFSNNIETAPVVESWMTESLFTEAEADLSTEEWMTEPMYANIEEGVMVETWMLNPMVEESNEVEGWMEQSFKPVNAEYTQVEAWMTRPMISEENVELENWMTEPLI